MLEHIKDFTASLGPTKESKKYMDLIFEKTSMWPNPQPTSPIAPGDYGYVDRKTDVFTIEGNIYDDGWAKELGIKSPETRAVEEELLIVSKDGKYTKPSVEAGPDIAGIAKLQLTYQVEFSHTRSALLLLLRPRLIEIPTPGSLRSLFSTPSLRGKAIVDRVYTCPAYVQVLTGSKNSKVNIGAVAEISAPIVGPVGTGGGVKWEWGVETSSGIENHASHTDYVCFPLYRLRMIDRFQVRIQVKAGDQMQGDGGPTIYMPPWGMLDDDGEEIPWSTHDMIPTATST